MARKYQLNFLEEEDQRKAFSKQQKSVQYKMNYLTCSILFILQVILFIRLQVFDPNGFHIVVVSALVSVVALAINHQSARFATILVFVQYILLNVQFTTDIYQRFIFQQVSNKPEMFLIGLGYGSLNLFIIWTFQKWYVRSACMWISCVLAFVWSDTNFTSKLSYLVIIYITTIFGIIFFYIAERFERENFSIIFQQNRSLSDWQRIIKENIPQSMVFVTRPKNKSTCSNASSQIKKELNDNQLSTKIELSNQIREKSDSKNVAKNNELVFNFVNKKFYDQFKIKDWVEKQQQQQQPLSNQAHGSQQQQQQQGLSKFALAGGLINKNQNDAISSNLICAESQLHQILFNSIFKNILVSPSEGGRSFNDFDSSAENTDKTVDTQTLSEFLKSFIDEQRNQCDQNYLSEDYQGSQNQNSQSSNRRDSISNPDLVKGLNCFYRPSPPSYVLGEQQILEEERQRQEQLPKEKEKEKGKKSLFPLFSQSSKAGALSAAETNDTKANKKQFTNNNFLTITETDNLVGPNSKLESGRESQQKEEILFTQDFVSPRIIDHLSQKNISKGLIESYQDQHTIINQDKLAPNNNKQQHNVKDSETKEAAKLFSNLEKEKSMGVKEFTPKKEISFIKTNQVQIQIPPPNKNPQDTLIEIEDDEDDEDSRDTKGKVQQNQKNKEVQYKMTSNRGAGSAIQTNCNSPLKNALDKASSGKDNLLIPQSNYLGNLQQGEYDKISIGTPREISKENQEGRGAAAILSNSQNIIQFERRTDSNQQRGGDQFNRNEADKEDESSQAFFFDTQMVSCMWGDEEGVLLILNDVSLKIINEKLREIERFKDKMLSTVTHDLKTPLNSIIMIMENSFEQKGGLGKKQRKIILQNSQMLMSLINDILDYSQIRRDKFRLIIEQIFISKCVLDVVDLFEMQAQQKRVKISAKFFNLKQEYMMNDERRIKQILVNLIGNALKFTQQEGSIEVIVKQKQPDCIQIAIRDTGTGISEEIQKKLFQFFNTFDHSEKANNRHGIGLGLAICKQLNSQLGPWHEIKLKSQVDKGSKFTFCVYVNLLTHEGIIDSPIQPALVPQKAVLERQMSVRLGPLESCKLEMLSNNTRRFQLHRSATENPKVKARQAHITNLIKWTTNQTISECMTGNSLQNIGQNVNIHPFMKDAARNQLSRKCSFNCEGDQASTKVSKQTGQQAQLRIPESKFSENYRLGSPLASPKISQPQKEFGPQYIKLKIQKRDSLKPTQFGLNSIPSIQSSGFLKLQESNYNLAVKSRGNSKEIPLNNIKGRSTNSRAVTVKLQIHEESRKSEILKAFTSEHTQSISNKTNSLIIPQYSPSAPISFKTRQQTQDSKNQNESMSPQFAHKLQEGTTSNIFGLKSKHIGQQSSAGSRSGSSRTSRGKYSYKTQRSHGFSGKLNLQNSQHFIESVVLGGEIFPSPSSKKQGKLTQINDQNLLETVEERVKASNQGNLLTTDDNNSEERASENFAQIEEFKNKFKAMPEHVLPSNDSEELSSMRNSVQIPNESVLIQTYDTEQLQANPSTLNHQNFSKNTVQSSQQMTNNNIIIHSSSSIVEVVENNQIIVTPQKKINMKTANEEEDNDDDYEDVMEEQEENGEELHGPLKNQKQILTAFGKSQNSATNKQQKFNQHQQEDEEEEEGRDRNQEEDNEEDDEDDDEEEENESNEEDDVEEDKNHKVVCSTDMHNNKNRGVNERKQQSEMLISLLQDYRCVLIADDSPFNIFCLEQVLGKNTQLKINVAYNGNEALNSYKKNREQIIFMDLNMPILDGYECMKCIRQFEEEMEIIERTKIIIISAQEYEPFFCNFDGFLSKPLKLLDIINLLALFKANDHNNNNNASADNINMHPGSLSRL